MEGFENIRGFSTPLSQIGKYRFIEQVGQGGMATVYKARDESLDRIVALKLLHSHLASNADVRARFAREAKAVARLKHPNIVEIYDSSTSLQADCYIVTEFVSGNTIKDFFEKEPPTLPEVAVMIAALLADALVHAHSLGIVHRDIKAENIMISTEGEVKLMDFGIAQMVDSTGRLTTTGTFIGSPAYMPPEQIEGKPVDGRADIYSIGIMLYELLTGKLPYTGDSTTSLLKNILSGEAVPPSRLSPHVCRQLNDIVLKAMSREPTQRFASAEAFKETLLDWLEISGITDPEETLKEYLTGGPAEKKRLESEVAISLEQAAEEAIKQKKHPYAIDLLNRLLAIAPEDAGIERKIQNLLNRKKWKLAAKFAGVTFALFAIIVTFAALIWQNYLSLPVTATDSNEREFLLEGSKTPLTEAPKAVLEETTIEELANSKDASLEIGENKAEEKASSPLVRRASAGMVASPSEALENRAAKKDKEREPVSRTPAEIALDPKKVIFRLNTWAQVEINGTLQKDAPRAVHELTLKPGKHRVAFINPNFSKLEETVTVPAEGEIPPFVFKLKAAPAKLYITNKQNAYITVDGHFARNAFETLNYPIIVEMREGHTKREIKLRLYKEDFSPHEQSLELKAGEEKHLTIDLNPVGG